VVDLHEHNKNTRKLSSPMPDMEGILRRVARKPYRSIIDGQDAYEQIRVIPEHVERTAVTTPDGNMVSHVIQQGDCNAPATYQALMNHMFGEHIGVFMDVYLDDIIIYSDTLEEHVRHVTTVIRILKEEKLYLSEKKLRFLCKEVKILGCVVTDDGIRMDPEKVDRVVNWKVPMNRTLCRGFVGVVGYLADDIFKVRVPLGVLAEASAESKPFQWGYTEQCAFETVKRYVSACAPHCRVPLDYSPDRDPIWVMTDACGNGIGGVVAQGHDWKGARVAAFYSAKMSSAQHNYLVHEQELMAGVETMLRHRDILQGVKFTWVTDHKSLTHILDQKGLSGRQARWMERLSEFDFTVLYVPGEENILLDALSRMYEFDAPGTIWSHDEYLQCDLDVADVDSTPLNGVISAPLLVGQEAIAPNVRRSNRLADRQAGHDIGRDAFVATPTPKRVILRLGPAATPKPSDGGEGNTSSAVGPVPIGQQEDMPPDQHPAPQTEANQHPTPHARVHRPRQPPTPVESGRPETGSEFAARMKDRFVLRGPRGRTEGGMGTATQPLSTSTPESETISAPVEPPERETRCAAPITYPHDENLLQEAKGRYKEDTFFGKILETPKAFKNFTLTEEGFIRLKLPDRSVICIPDIRIGERTLREMVIDQAHSLLAHLGSRKTLSYLWEYVWWDTMVHDVATFCTSCTTCQRSKPPNQKPYGLLNPLSVPSAPWNAIGVDFVGPLPESKDRDGSYDSITVIIDLLTVMIHLVPSQTTYTAKDIAELMFAEVYKLHGLPRTIVSDRDVLFTSLFWTHLNKLMGVKQRMSSAYHPETDGSTERANRTIGQMLRSCIGPTQKDWVTRLPAIEFAINLA